MNLPPSAQQITATQHLVAHLDSTVRRLCSYLQYIGVVKYSKAIEALLQHQEINLDWCDPALEYPCCSPPFMQWRIHSNPLATLNCRCITCTRGRHIGLHNHRNTQYESNQHCSNFYTIQCDISRFTYKQYFMSMHATCLFRSVTEEAVWRI